MGKDSKEERLYKKFETWFENHFEKWFENYFEKWFEKNKKIWLEKHGINLTVVVNTPDVVQNSIHNPQNPFAISHKHSSAAASRDELATSSSGNYSPAQATDDGSASAFGSSASDNNSQSAVDKSENEYQSSDAEPAPPTG